MTGDNKQQGMIKENGSSKKPYSESIWTHNEDGGLGKPNTHVTYCKRESYLSDMIA